MSINQQIPNRVKITIPWQPLRNHEPPTNKKHATYDINLTSYLGIHACNKAEKDTKSETPLT